MTERLSGEQNGNNEELFYPITFEELESTVLPDNLFAYPDNSGETSYGAGSFDEYDMKKMTYMEGYGVEIPELWRNQRELLINGFLALKGIIAWTNAVREGEDAKDFYEFITRWWNENRIDQIGYRIQGRKRLYQEYFLGMANPTRQLSNDEFKGVCQYVVRSLSKKED